MTDDDLETIPILDDILIAGDLNKAVTGDIDLKGLESIESFDALFESFDSTDADSNHDAEDANEFLSEEYPEEAQADVMTDAAETSTYTQDDFELAYQTASPTEDVTDSTAIAQHDSAPAIPVDTNPLIEILMQEIMPALETRIRQVILSALENNLGASRSHPPSDADSTDEPTSQNLDS